MSAWSLFQRFEHEQQARDARLGADQAELILWKGTHRGTTPRCLALRKSAQIVKPWPIAWRLTEGNEPRDPQYKWEVAG